MTSKCFISCLNLDKELEHFEVPKEVYTYIKQLESSIKYPEASKLTTMYSDRFPSKDKRDTLDCEESE